MPYGWAHVPQQKLNVSHLLIRAENCPKLSHVPPLLCGRMSSLRSLVLGMSTAASKSLDWNGELVWTKIIASRDRPLAIKKNMPFSICTLIMWYDIPMAWYSTYGWGCADAVPGTCCMFRRNISSFSPSASLGLIFSFPRENTLSKQSSTTVVYFGCLMLSAFRS